MPNVSGRRGPDSERRWTVADSDRRETCRYCGQEVILGKHGWRLDNNSVSGERCPTAPRGYHGIDKRKEIEG